MNGDRNKTADFRSDTFTMPDSSMRRAIYEAEVGNSGYGEDPSVNALEEIIADFFARDAALFLPSATMAGQIAIRIWARPGDVIIIEEYGHNYYFETGAMSAISGAQAHTLSAELGILKPGEIANAIIHPENPYAHTALIVLENTSNFGGGTIYPQTTLENVFEIAANHDLPVHIDGARIWNALLATGYDPAKVMQPGGSMSVCFSKGLGAPMGAILLGDTEFIREARRIQQMLGGVMRQIGFMAAAAMYAFQNNMERLTEDHENALLLARTIAHIQGIKVNLDAVQSNIVYADVEVGTERAAEIVKGLDAQSVRTLNVGSRIRFVTSMLVNENDCVQTAIHLEHVMDSK